MENTTQQTEELKNMEAENAASGNAATEPTPQDQTAEQPSTGEETKKQETKTIESEVLKLQSEIAESKDKYLRLYSEFENFRRRTSREKLDMIQSANEQLIRALLPVADDFERAERSLKEKNDKDSEGFALISNKFKKVLDQYGVKAMDLQPGAEFNPDVHEAITQIPAPEEGLKGKIVDVVEKGYLLNEKVIRYAKVVVGN
jgi:molecular chaperone GrpE